MAGSDDLEELKETYIQDGKGGKRLVKLGDQINLLPPELYKRDRKGKDWEVLAKKHVAFLHEWLGEGPFTISWIGHWPCGRIMLYLKGAKTDRLGSYASNFM